MAGFTTTSLLGGQVYQAGSGQYGGQYNNLQAGYINSIWSSNSIGDVVQFNGIRNVVIASTPKRALDRLRSDIKDWHGNPLGRKN